jgi:hypothetical protein
MWNPPNTTLVLPATSSKISSVGMSLQTGTVFVVVVDEDEEDGVSRGTVYDTGPSRTTLP